MMNLLRRAWRVTEKCPCYWPSLGEEIEREYLDKMTGTVLNAGSGMRALQPFVSGRVVNQDIYPALDIHVVSPLHKIPVEAAHFDSVFCNAVLEHVVNPVEVVLEFQRVLKPGGHLFLGVPLMQPEHKNPTDYQRYTIDGLVHLVETHGFKVLKIANGTNVYQTIAWIVHEWLTSRRSVRYWLLRKILYPVLWYQCRHSRVCVDSVASFYKLLAVRV